MTEPTHMKNFVRKCPDGDTHDRDVCSTCGFIDYQNPKMIVGSVVRHAGRILMCRRAIEPSIGLWTLPAGYLEIGETVAEGAQREAREEACATIAIDAVLAIYSLPNIAQVQIIHLATLVGHDFASGPESMEVELFAWDNLPWEQLAFPSVAWALRHTRMVLDYGAQMPFTSPAD